MGRALAWLGAGGSVPSHIADVQVGRLNYGTRFVETALGSYRGRSSLVFVASV